jgi:hypothetical protein
VHGGTARAISSLSGAHEFNSNGNDVVGWLVAGETGHAIGPVLDVLPTQKIRNPNLPFALADPSDRRG